MNKCEMCGNGDNNKPKGQYPCILCIYHPIYGQVNKNDYYISKYLKHQLELLKEIIVYK